MNKTASLIQKLKAFFAQKQILTASILTISSLALALALYFNLSTGNRLTASVAESTVEIASFPIVQPTLKWGFAIDTFQVLERNLRPGQSLSDILLAQQLDAAQRQQLIDAAGQVFDLRNLRPDKNFFILTKDSTQTGNYLVYEPSVYEYLLFDLNQLTVTRIQREVTRQPSTAAGVITSSLWQAMVGNGFSYELTDKMEDALQWSVDFHHLQPGDEFRLVYEQLYVEGEPVGVGPVHAAYYQTGDKEFYAFYYENGDIKGYFNQDGQPMKSGFLKAPVKYSRISSYYNLNRLHPILKYRRPHYGTDYAAPYGTPILAVGDGVVSAASYTSGNGNFVKIKHDNVYETQYLHMQKFAPGIRAGVSVQQGQVIGYVGSTGLATGPHVCFRFWKNGQQVNHLKLDLPPPAPLPAAEMPAFTALRDAYLAQLKAASPDGIPTDVPSDHP